MNFAESHDMAPAEADDPDPPWASFVHGDVRVDAYAQTDGPVCHPMSAVDGDALCALAVRTVLDEGVSAGQIDLHFVDTEIISALNEEHMGGSGPTDVLSFPMFEPSVFAAPTPPELGQLTADGETQTEIIHDGFDEVDFFGVEDLPPFLGDIVIAPAVAVDQAPSHAGDPAAELALLTVHGVLHLLGHDHALTGEAEIMRAAEARQLARIGVAHPGAQESDHQETDYQETDHGV